MIPNFGFDPPSHPYIEAKEIIGATREISPQLAFGCVLGDIRLSGGCVSSSRGGGNRLLAIKYRSAQIDDLADEYGGLKNGGDYGRNPYPDRPPLIQVVALYVLSMGSGALRWRVGTLNLNHHRCRVGAALIAVGGARYVGGSIRFVLGLGLPWPKQHGD